MNGFHKQRLVTAICAGAGMLATFLPWATMPMFGSVSGTAGDGWITLALFVPALVLALMGDKTQPLLGAKRYGAVIPSGLSALLGLWKMIQLSPLSPGIGLLLLVASGGSMCVCAWVLAKPTQN